jgi:UDP-N-acetylglucosamine transferase subunit ALG13
MSEMRELKALSEVEDLRGKLRMIISHASGGSLSKPADVDRSINDICVEISRHKNEIWDQAQKSALAKARTLSIPSDQEVEKVARAIYESVFADDWTGGDGIEAEQYRQAARAAILALREGD